jgi:hypothetical protein
MSGINSSTNSIHAELINQALTINNLCVVLLREGQFETAKQECHKVLSMIEKPILGEINRYIQDNPPGQNLGMNSALIGRI